MNQAKVAQSVKDILIAQMQQKQTYDRNTIIQPHSKLEHWFSEKI